MNHKVFVYGTLKKNEPNHHWLTNKENGESIFHAYGATVTKYPLIIATKYNIPFLLKDPGNGHFVKGKMNSAAVGLVIKVLNCLAGGHGFESQD